MSTPKNRPQRTPIRERSRFLGFERPGFHLRWVNDELGRVEDLRLDGYRPVVYSAQDVERRGLDASQIGSVVKMVVNRSPNAATHYAILMEIPEEEYEARQLAKTEELDRVEEALDPKKRRQQGSDYGSMKKSFS